MFRKSENKRIEDRKMKHKVKVKIAMVKQKLNEDLSESKQKGGRSRLFRLARQRPIDGKDMD